MISEWPEVELGKLLEITSSKRIFREDYVEEGVPFFRSKEVIERSDGKEISTELYIAREKFNEIKKKFGAPSVGDILLTSVGTLGVSYQVEPGDEFYFKDGNLTWFRNFSDKINSRYVLCWLKSPVAKRALEMITIGSTQKALTIVSLKKIKIPLPDKNHQARIVEIYDSLSEKLRVNRQINQTLEQIAQTIFKSWFVDFEPVKAKIAAKAAGRDPERAAMCAINGKLEPALDQLSPEEYQQLTATAALFPDDLVESELGLIPAGWDCGPIKSFGEITIGGDWGKDEPETGDYVQATSLRGVDLEHLRSTGEAPKAPVRWVKKSSIEKRTPNECDVLIGGSGAGPCGRPLWLSEKIQTLFDAPLVYSNFVKRIRCKDKAQAIFLDFVLWEMFDEGEIQNFINGTSVPNLNDKGLMARLAVLPDTKVLSAFHLTAMGWHMNLYSGQSRTLATLRDTLLPKLLSGELAVETAQNEATSC